MKLPDFARDERFLDLRRKMGIPAEYVALFPERAVETELSYSEKRALRSDGIDVDIGKLSIHTDNTMAYKKCRVLIYIRDVHDMGLSAAEPRYHLAYCQVMQQMCERCAVERYVVSTEITGTFKVNYIKDRHARPETRQLPVCRHCLEMLGLCGYKSTLSQAQRYAIVRNFSPGIFYERYPMSLYSWLPGDFADGREVNVYPGKWAAESERIRRKASWRCGKCGQDFNWHRRLLDVHHKDGNRRNRDETNLEVLCVRCHADEANHEHMRRDPRYREYVRLIGFRSR
jgi:hypothetical protein